MQVRSTEPVIYLTDQSRKVMNMFGYVPWSVGWSLVPRTFPRMSCSLAFLPALFAALLRGVRAKKDKETATHAWAISHARSARPPGRPDERPDE